MNEVKLSGRIYRPELKYTAQGMAITKFSIGNTRKIKGEFKTDFFNCVCFKEVAEKVSQIQEKSKVSIVGILIQERWEKDGKKNSAVKIIVNSFQTEEQPKQSEEKVVEMNLDDLEV